MTKVLIGKRTKAIYGTLFGAVLFCNKLNGVLVNLDFEINVYNKYTFISKSSRSDINLLVIERESVLLPRVCDHSTIDAIYNVLADMSPIQ